MRSGREWKIGNKSERERERESKRDMVVYFFVLLSDNMPAVSQYSVSAALKFALFAIRHNCCHVMRLELNILENFFR